MVTETGGKLDTFATIVGLVCVVTLTTVMVVYIVRGDRAVQRMGDELRDAAQKLRDLPPPDVMPAHTEN
jgi:hypothetical protein